MAEQVEIKAKVVQTEVKALVLRHKKALEERECELLWKVSRNRCTSTQSTTLLVSVHYCYDDSVYSMFFKCITTCDSLIKKQTNSFTSFESLWTDSRHRAKYQNNKNLRWVLSKPNFISS